MVQRRDSVWVPLIQPPLVNAANMKRAATEQQPFPGDCLPKLRQAVLKARSKWELQRAQCLLLRATYHLPSWQIGELIGWSVNSVRRMHSRYLREGDAALAGPGRGGRRNQLLSVTAEAKVLRAVRREAWPEAYVDAAVVRLAYERAVARPVTPSTVYRMLARHGWLKAPVLRVPAAVGRAKSYFSARLPPVADGPPPIDDSKRAQ